MSKHSEKRIGPRMLRIQEAVAANPGLTANRYARTAFDLSSSTRIYMGSIYVGFQRALAAKLIRSVTTDRGFTIYFPVEKQGG